MSIASVCLGVESVVRAQNLQRPRHRSPDYRPRGSWVQLPRRQLVRPGVRAEDVAEAFQGHDVRGLGVQLRVSLERWLPLEPGAELVIWSRIKLPGALRMP